MRTAYIYFLADNSSIGVLNKPEQQVKGIEKLYKMNIDVFVFNIYRHGYINNVRYIKLYRNNPFELYNILFNKKSLIERSIDLTKYSRIILRYSGIDKSIVELVINKNVIFELHSKIISELELKIGNTKSIIAKVRRNLLLYQTKKYLFTALRKSKGIICNSFDVRDDIICKIGDKIPITVIPNGIDIDSIAVSGFAKFDSECLKLGFLLSGPHIWQGIERLISSAEVYLENNNVDLNIEINLIGNVKYKSFDKYAKNVKLNYCGTLIGNELTEKLGEMNIAISSLSIYLQSLSNKSTLKTAEYLARGIPFILGYNDTCFYDNKYEKKFYLRFSNNDSVIDFNKIIDFCNYISKDQVNITSEMRQYAEFFLDWRIIMKKYNEFIR